MTTSGSFRKKILCVSMASALGLSVGAVHADVYELSWRGAFTMVNTTGSPVQNKPSDYTSGYYANGDSNDLTSGAPSFPANVSPTADCKTYAPACVTVNSWYGNRTPVSGTISFDTSTGAGVVTVNPFFFFGDAPGSGPNTNVAFAQNVTFQVDTDGTRTGTAGTMISTLLFSWNGGGHSLSLVLDASGMLANLSPTSGTISGASLGVVALPATDDMNFGTAKAPKLLPLGPAPLAVKTLNTGSGCNGIPLATQVDPLDSLSSINTNETNVATCTTGMSDDGIGGVPMTSGGFPGFNGNFDFTSMTVTGFRDTTAPNITLTGASTINLNVGDTYSEPGATCTDAPPVNSNLNGSIVITGGDDGNGNVDTSTAHSTTLTYTCTDAAGKTASTTRTVVVSAVNAPVITLVPPASVTHEACTTYTDAGATATDPDGGTVTLSPTDLVNPNVNTEGTYTFTWDAIDDEGVSAIPVTRTVTVVDTLLPVITLSGSDPTSLTLESNQSATFSPPTGSAVDQNNCSPPGPLTVTRTGTVNFTVPNGEDSVGSTLLYTATDSAATPHTTNRGLAVTVFRSEPVITLVGDNPLILAQGDTFADPGVTVHDVQDDDATLTASVVVGGNTVDTSVPGDYTVTYDVIDSGGNSAAQRTRTVTVRSGVTTTTNSNFTMLNGDGAAVGGTNDVISRWDGSLNTSVADTNFNMTLSSVTPFFGANWTAHTIRVFGPGTYTFNTGCTRQEIASGIPPNACAIQSTPLTMTVGDNQLGAHMLFDWRAATDIDVVNVWERDAKFDGKLWTEGGVSADTVWGLASSDNDSDGKPGVPMVDGPFQGFNANFNIIGSGGIVVPPPGDPVNVEGTSTGGCSISPRPVAPSDRTDWWLVAGFLAWLGAIRKRFKRQSQSC